MKFLSTYIKSGFDICFNMDYMNVSTPEKPYRTLGKTPKSDTFNVKVNAIIHHFVQ